MSEGRKSETVEAFGSFPVDLLENERGTLILADLPGVTREALAVSLKDDELTIEGRRHLGGETLRLRRRFRVDPEAVDAETIVAKLEHGVLRLELPKPAAQQPRRIEVRVG
ncbi:MAG: Hsp20/alpha crystallin family protein [Myxococcota bacterium]